jgi:hypothetical protein
VVTPAVVGAKLSIASSLGRSPEYMKSQLAQAATKRMLAATTAIITRLNAFTGVHPRAEMQPIQILTFFVLNCQLPKSSCHP